MSGIYIETYGCQMNEYESDRTYRYFHEQLGFERVSIPEEADFVLLNTCSIREKADQKAFSSIGKLRALKSANPEMIVAVGGCTAQAQGNEIQQRFPFVDIVFGTHQWSKLPQLVAEARKSRRQILETEFFGWKRYDFLPYRASKISHPVTELVTIQNGCDKFCTFCLVPFTRGREMSRPSEEVIAEVNDLVEQGVREVILLGQNVNAYGRDRKADCSLPELLRRLSGIKELRRLRFITSHPAELTDDIIEEMASSPVICPHLHLPLQSGSDKILSRMNRNHNRAHYARLVNRLKAKIPGFSLTTDFIVGFPSETEEDFRETLSALEEFEFEDSYSFCFSPRPHTKAAHWTDEFVLQEVALERLYRLQELQVKVKDAKHKRLIGRDFEVLVEGRANKGDGMLTGRTKCGKSVNFAGPPEFSGTFVHVKLTEPLTNTFRGELNP